MRHHLLPRYRTTPTQPPTPIHNLQPPTPKPTTPTPPGGDPWTLRGIPALGHGIPGGAIPGTRPDTLTWVDTRNKKPRTRN